MEFPKRLSLVQRPTALHPLARLSKILGGPELWIKRDDNTGLALGGNKARKLEFLLADALRQGASDILTVGGIQSNHARMTAAAAASLGLNCHLFLRGDKSVPLQGNTLLDALFGAEIHYLSQASDRDAAMKEAAAALCRRGRRPYCIRVGGSNALGSLGYAAAVGELMEQIPMAEFFHRCFVAVGSGGTYAGLCQGAAEFHWPARIEGICVDDERFAEIIWDIMSQANSAYGLTLPKAETIHLNYGFLGSGYGRPTDEALEAISLFARHEGILLDPVYTGKAAAGLIQKIRSGEIERGERVLFWHTGGAPALFASPELFPEAVDL